MISSHRRSFPRGLTRALLLVVAAGVGVSPAVAQKGQRPRWQPPGIGGEGPPTPGHVDFPDPFHSPGGLLGYSSARTRAAIRHDEARATMYEARGLAVAGMYSEAIGLVTSLPLPRGIVRAAEPTATLFGGNVTSDADLHHQVRRTYKGFSKSYRVLTDPGASSVRAYGSVSYTEGAQWYAGTFQEMMAEIQAPPAGRVRRALNWVGARFGYAAPSRDVDLLERGAATSRHQRIAARALVALILEEHAHAILGYSEGAVGAMMFGVGPPGEVGRGLFQDLSEAWGYVSRYQSRRWFIAEHAGVDFAGFPAMPALEGW